MNDVEHGGGHTCMYNINNNEMPLQWYKIKGRTLKIVP